MIKSLRYPIIDTIRGLAILAMMMYHFGFDLNMQGYIVQDLNHSLVWQIARSLILGTFLFVSGFSMALAAHHSLKMRLLRLARIVGCAMLVSMMSYIMFPTSWIFFGVLHFIVIANLICWIFMKYEKLLLPTAIIVLAFGFFHQSALFDQPLLQWIGMMTHKPITEDYVPILPWLGIMLIGLYIGKSILREKNYWLLSFKPNAVLKPAQWLGKHSLAVYMLHQPLLLGILIVFGIWSK